jgi:hypothetical protein
MYYLVAQRGLTVQCIAQWGVVHCVANRQRWVCSLQHRAPLLPYAWTEEYKHESGLSSSQRAVSEPRLYLDYTQPESHTDSVRSQCTSNFMKYIIMAKSCFLLTCTTNIALLNTWDHLLVR